RISGGIIPIKEVNNRSYLQLQNILEKRIIDSKEKEANQMEDKLKISRKKLLEKILSRELLVINEEDKEEEKRSIEELRVKLPAKKYRVKWKKKRKNISLEINSIIFLRKKERLKRSKIHTEGLESLFVQVAI
ncbi:13867_t:CDS:2, partial [Ambispora leptoticha]